MTKTMPKNKPANYKNDNVLEQLRGVGNDVAGNTVDVAAKIGENIFSSLIGGSTLMSGDLEPNQTIELGLQPQIEVEKPQMEAPKMETSHTSIEAITEQTKQQLEAVREELKALSKSLRNLSQDVQSAIEQTPVSPGVYHINYYDQLRTFIHVLRQQIEDSRVWLSMSVGRKKKMGYWGMFKKHGTSFGLSNERSLATAAG